MMLVKVNKSGKWVVTRLVKDHTHPLVASGRPCRNAMVSSCIINVAIVILPIYIFHLGSCLMFYNLTKLVTCGCYFPGMLSKTSYEPLRPALLSLLTI